MKLDTKAMIFEKAKAGYPALYLVSSEDQRSLREIKEAADELKRTLYIWTLGKGLVKEGGVSKGGRGGAPTPIADTEIPPGALAEMAKAPEKSIFVLRLFHHFLEAPNIQSMLIDLIPDFKLNAKMLIILTPVQKLPPELEKEFALIETALPDKQMLERVLTGIIVGSRLPDDKKPSPEVKKLLIDAAAGLTTPEADNAFALSLLRPSIQKTGMVWDPQVVLEEKMAALKKTGLLEYIPAGTVSMQSVGGMKALKRWIALRKRAFTEEAKTFGLPAPKGILMVGPPGSGKSLGAKAVSNELNLPLIRCDFGKLLGSLVGQSEGNMRKAIDVAEAASPCVLWIDEIEKALAGSSGGSHDSGVGARLLGYLLTWMAEKTSPVFVYATANDVTSLPPELLRKGRFDEMWSVLLPNDEERKEIFNIHLKKRGRGDLVGDKSKNKQAIDLDHFSKDTAGFSGAEIEAAVIESLFLAFDEKRDLTFMDLQNAIDDTMPLSTTMSGKIKALEEWCRDKTRSSNGDDSYNIDAILKAGGSRKVETV